MNPDPLPPARRRGATEPEPWQLRRQKYLRRKNRAFDDSDLRNVIEDLVDMGAITIEYDRSRGGGPRYRPAEKPTP